ncbi:MAG: hypothetical protein E4G98_02640 [Promethearchaeota archaeon]|nr:MAG: hypothetical protein E4G98_02640 [Candidatus Lokiarchaeota archaeon]
MESFIGSEAEITDILYKMKRIFTVLTKVQKNTQLAPDIHELLATSFPIFTKKFLLNPSKYPNVLDHVKRQRIME